MRVVNWIEVGTTWKWVQLERDERHLYELGSGRGYAQWAGPKTDQWQRRAPADVLQKEIDKQPARCVFPVHLNTQMLLLLLLLLASWKEKHLSSQPIENQSSWNDF